MVIGITFSLWLEELPVPAMVTVAGDGRVAVAVLPVSTALTLDR